MLAPTEVLVPVGTFFGERVIGTRMREGPDWQPDNNIAAME